MRAWVFLAALVMAVAQCGARADGPADNQVDSVRRIPPPGIAVSDSDRAELEAGLAALGRDIDRLKETLKPPLLELLPDVEIYHKAVRYALEFGEFFNAREIPVAKQLLKQGMERAEELTEGRAPWTTAMGLVVRGYRSKIDGSAQPYGLVVPETFANRGPHRFRLDLWFHGRGETLSEVNFINDRQRNPGEFRPPDTFVLHPYGRYCNANKMAGEVDTFEALEHAKRHYPIGSNRIAVRGFSMGGAACWQFAVHFPGEWAAAAPGAGFSETPDFLKVFQNETLQPTWYEQKLWRMYDCTDYALNLFNVPTVAYSGENDKQKQAADVMAKAAVKEGIKLVHIIGPKTGHSYEAGAKAEINDRIDKIMERGRNPVPPRVRFTTYTLRYNRCAWVTLEGLEKHWEKARIDAEIVSPERIVIKTKNVTALSLNFKPGECPMDVTRKPVLEIDGQRVTPARPAWSDRSWSAHLQRSGGRWAADAVPKVYDPHPVTLGKLRPVAEAFRKKLQKRPGLQGPIDDAFWESFVFVRPTGKPVSEKVGAWVVKEMEHAITHWRRQFRGEVRVVDDTAVTGQMIESSNLILWGDPSSNAVLARIKDKLPVDWGLEILSIGPHSYSASDHVPVLIFPNPMNEWPGPRGYVVLNSGFTFREYDYLNNARQVPKLPDWAIVDITKPVTSRHPGGIVNAGFFGEKWEYVEPPNDNGKRQAASGRRQPRSAGVSPAARVTGGTPALREFR